MPLGGAYWCVFFIGEAHQAPFAAMMGWTVCFSGRCAIMLAGGLGGAYTVRIRCVTIKVRHQMTLTVTHLKGDAPYWCRTEPPATMALRSPCLAMAAK